MLHELAVSREIFEKIASSFLRQQALAGVYSLERGQDRSHDVSRRRGWQVEADRGRLREHRVVLACVAGHRAEIGAHEHDRLLDAVA